MKTIIKIAITFSFITLSSCNLLEGDGVVNPNVDENTYLSFPHPMESWVNGAERSLAIAVGDYTQLLEILSDNYYNNYSRSSNVFDAPKLLNTDYDIERLQRYVGTLREQADYGFNTVAKHDSDVTDAQRLKLSCIRAYAGILAGETFTGLPLHEGDDVATWKEQLETANADLDKALGFAKADSSLAIIYTLKARTFYRLGNIDEATKAAQLALNADNNFAFSISFDPTHGVSNAAQEAIGGNWFQPLPRLDFLDPKYYSFSSQSNEQRPIVIAKAEEDYLILAEAAIANNDGFSAKSWLHRLLDLVSSRPLTIDPTTNQGLDDHLDNRYNGGTRHNPTGSMYTVAAEPGEEYRSGLILDRDLGHTILVPYISGTSVTSQMIDDCSTNDTLLRLIYLMRQEIFIGEGRRVADLGIRLPLSNVEAGHVSNANDYTSAIIPFFIPLDGGMDKFTVDESTKRVTIEYDMNRIIVENGATAFKNYTKNLVR